jgi:hypothetical protein
MVGAFLSYPLFSSPSSVDFLKNIYIYIYIYIKAKDLASVKDTQQSGYQSLDITLDPIFDSLDTSERIIFSPQSKIVFVLTLYFYVYIQHIIHTSNIVGIH